MNKLSAVLSAVWPGGWAIDWEVRFFTPCQYRCSVWLSVNIGLVQWLGHPVSVCSIELALNSYVSASFSPLAYYICINSAEKPNQINFACTTYMDEKMCVKLNYTAAAN